MANKDNKNITPIWHDVSLPESGRYVVQEPEPTGPVYDSTAWTGTGYTGEAFARRMDEKIERFLNRPSF